MPTPKKPAKDKKKPKINRLHRPDHMTLEEWQIELRRQFGREQPFRWTNLSEEPVFSQFRVLNPQTKGKYRVTVRGRNVGDNSCTCGDFMTNELGTCKHIEFVLGKLESKRKQRAILHAGYQPESPEIYLRYGSQRRVLIRLPHEPKPALKKLVGKYFDGQHTLRPEVLATFDDFLDELMRLDPNTQCGDDVLQYLAEIHDHQERQRRLQAAFPEGVESKAFADLLKVQLYAYQREGALFAAKAGRSLIGDEMGLGKTIQALAAAEIMARTFNIERVLIVCPTSLKHQWKTEIAKFTHRTAKVVEGLLADRAAAFQSKDVFYLIMNYDTVHTDLDRINQYAPDLVILDEAQRIKNWSTRVARSVKKINSPHALVLTGTPLENRLEELISIVQFVDLHRLGPTYRLLDQHQKRDDVGKVIGYRDLDKIGQTLAPIMVRRKKKDVALQLPERVENTIFVPMTELQRQFHDENREIVAAVVAKWRKYRFLSEKDKLRLMMGLQGMRMSCDSSYLLDEKTNEGLKVGEVMTATSELLEDPTTKIVIFSQWLRMHELMVAKADDLGFGHVFFHGGVPGKKRAGLIEKFRDDPNCRLFFATDAGGVGLNLQFASAVFNVDLPWNPAVLGQRVGRVHRLGQKDTVRVLNFVAKGTIEEQMLDVLKFKSDLSAGVLDGGESEINLRGSRLTQLMETIEATTQNLPAVNEAEGEEAREAKREFAETKPSPSSGAGESGALPVPADNPWQGLLQAGMSLLQQFAQPTPGTASPLSGKPSVQRDDKTGETYLRLPVPAPDKLQEATKAIQTLLQLFGGK